MHLSRCPLHPFPHSSHHVSHTHIVLVVSFCICCTLELWHSLYTQPAFVAPCLHLTHCPHLLHLVHSLLPISHLLHSHIKCSSLASVPPSLAFIVIFAFVCIPSPCCVWSCIYCSRSCTHHITPCHPCICCITISYIISALSL